MDSSPTIERYFANKEWCSTRADLVVDEFPEKEWSGRRAIDIRRSALIKQKQDADSAIAEWHRTAEASNVIINDEGHNVPGSMRSGPALTELRRAERVREKAVAALGKLEREAKLPRGRTGWMVKGPEVAALIRELARRNAPAEPYILKGKPSRKGMNDAAKVAEAGHARRKQIVEAYPDRATAEAMVRGLLRSEDSPLRLSLNPYHMARQLNLPLVSMKWGPGRSEPLPEDVAAMFQFLAAERIEDDLMEQLDRRYTAFKADGVLTLTEPERRRELAIVDEAIHAAELEEAAHLIGLIESEGTLILPPARMGAKALLGIA